MHKERANMTKTDELVELAAVYFGSSVVSGVDFILQYLATYIVLIEKPTSVTNQNVRISKMLWKVISSLISARCSSFRVPLTPSFTPLL